jgi:hypothetical protein
MAVPSRSPLPEPPRGLPFAGREDHPGGHLRQGRLRLPAEPGGLQDPREVELPERLQGQLLGADRGRRDGLDVARPDQDVGRRHGPRLAGGLRGASPAGGEAPIFLDDGPQEESQGVDPAGRLLGNVLYQSGWERPLDVGDEAPPVLLVQVESRYRVSRGF